MCQSALHLPPPWCRIEDHRRDTLPQTRCCDDPRPAPRASLDHGIEVRRPNATTGKRGRGDGALHRAARATFRAFAKNPDRDSERHPAGRSYSRATGALSPAPGLGRTGTDARKRQIAHSLLFRIKFPDLLQ